MIDTREERGLAAVAHVLGLFTGFLGPLLMYLLKTEEGLARDQAREALNFQISILIGCAVATILLFVVIGILLFTAIGIADVVLSIVAATRAYNGQRYRYPVSIRLVTGPAADTQV